MRLVSSARVDVPVPGANESRPSASCALRKSPGDEERTGMPRHPVILSANEIRRHDPGRAAGMVEALLLKGDSAAPGGGAYDLLGQIYLAAGDLRSARDSFEKDLEVYPDSHGTFLYMGLIDEISGESARAREWYARAREREFDNSYVHTIRQACQEWQRKHPGSESRIKLLDARRRLPPLFARKKWWQFWKA
jgi:tetratricopeptide (TPR) repeat protein